MVQYFYMHKHDPHYTIKQNVNPFAYDKINHIACIIIFWRAATVWNYAISWELIYTVFI